MDCPVIILEMSVDYEINMNVHPMIIHGRSGILLVSQRHAIQVESIPRGVLRG